MLTLPSALERNRRLFGHRPAMVGPQGALTWSEFAARVAKGAGALAGLGLEPGERYAIVAHNTQVHWELLYAGYWLGAVPVPINYRLAAPEIRFILEDAGCKLLVLEDFYAGLLESPDLSPWAESAVFLSGVEAPAGPGPRFEDLLRAAEPLAGHQPGENDDATLLYTGGTTGRSKGVRLSHRNILSNAMQVTAPMTVVKEDIYLHVPPMFHAADLLGTAYTLAGAAHAFLPQFTGRDFLEALSALGVTKTMLTPTMIIVTLQEDDLDTYDLSKFKLLFYGSAPLAVEWIKRAMEKFPSAALEQGYGLTETSPILTILDPQDHVTAIETGDHEILKAAGRPVVGIDMLILDDQGKEVAPGEVGEVCVRGPNVTKGYLNLPEVNAETFRDGWFHTGDMGRMDDRGFMYLMDRKKDVIITGGENVYSSEVEAVLYKHPDVHECAVVGVRDEKFGEALFAAIVPRPGSTLTEEGIISHCRKHIGGYKIPRRMAFVDELPKTAVGKIQKVELRRIYGG